MTCAYPPEATLSSAERCVLGTLNQVWPSAATMTPDVFDCETPQDNQASFVNTVQNLSDNGMILYEAFLAGSTSEPRFLDTMITARGKAALQAGGELV
jgi:hypothetical protein